MLKKLYETHPSSFFIIDENTHENALFGAGPKATLYLLNIGVSLFQKNYNNETPIDYAKYNIETLRIFADYEKEHPPSYTPTAQDLLLAHENIDPIDKYQQQIERIGKKLDNFIIKTQFLSNKINELTLKINNF